MSAVNGTIGTYIRKSLVSKIAVSVLSTTTAYALVPVAFHYAVGDFNKELVSVVVAVWALSLTRMWVEVISLSAQAMAKIPVATAIIDLAANLRMLAEIDLVAGVPLN